MQSEAKGFSLRKELRWRSWSGFVADVWDVDCEPDAAGNYYSPDPRLFVVLELTGGALELSNPGEGERALHRLPFSMAFIPAGVQITSLAIGASHLKHLDIHLPEPALHRMFGRNIPADALQSTRLQFNDSRIARIASLIAEECENDQPFSDSYGEAMMNALIVALFDLRRVERKPRPTLSRKQLSQSMDYMNAHCFETIRLQDIASLLGLSESYFSHAFKASTGVPPSRWQMETRIGKVKELLSRDSTSLTEIAAITGFADQAHLTRAFKKLVGSTPAQWRREASLDE
ncbi:MAG: AraC family transcriptional regulator [Mesorhizobium sp.]